MKMNLDRGQRKLLKLREAKLVDSSVTDENVTIWSHEKVIDEKLNLNLFVEHLM